MNLAQSAVTSLMVLTALPSLAQTAAPEPDYSLSGNVGIFSDYRFRGISQTNKNPAIQGGVDFSMKNGLYLGNWNSNVDSGFYNGANIEMDFYGGWKATFGEFGLDLGGIYYYYPGSGDNPGTGKIDNFELYAGGTWGPLTLKYNYATTDFFGAPNSSGAYYVYFGAAHDFGNGFGISGSVGYQGGLKNGACPTEIGAGAPVCSITDWKIGGTYTVDGWVFGLAYIDTNRDLTGGTAANSNRNISGATGVLSVAKSF